MPLLNAEDDCDMGHYGSWNRPQNWNVSVHCFAVGLEQAVFSLRASTSAGSWGTSSHFLLREFLLALLLSWAEVCVCVCVYLSQKRMPNVPVCATL